MSTIDDIKNLAEAVKNETANNANTATRIGSLLVKIIEAIESIIPEIATTTEDGLMSSEDKTKLNSIENDAQKNPGVATTSSNGLMSAEDKISINKSLNKIDFEYDYGHGELNLIYYNNGSSVYTEVYIPQASDETSGVMSINDKVKLDSIESGAQKNPSIATSSSNGLMSATDKKKLDNLGSISFDKADDEILVSVNGESTQSPFPMATEDYAGAITASDKQKLNKISLSDLTNIKSSITRLGISQLSSDADDVKSTIRLFAVEGSTNVPSIPCYLEVLAYHPNFILQRATDISGVEKRRVFTDNNWSQWQ